MIPAAAEKYVHYREPGIILLHGDCRDILPQLEHAVQCCVTSPPYWGLRDYGVEGQLGLEETPEEYTERMAEVFSAVSDILLPDGTLWLNLGDSYAGSWGAQSRPNGNDIKSTLQGGSRLSARQIKEHPKTTHIGSLKNTPGLKPKDMVGIPWRVAFALQTEGWYLRSDIIWSKPNPMPESVTDRPTKAHEYIFLMSKSEKYYYDHEAVKVQGKTHEYDARCRGEGRDYKKAEQPWTQGNSQRPHMGFKNVNTQNGVNRRTVWEVATKPYPGAHFAVFPPELIEPCILAGTKEGDIVLDPFSGSGTVGQVCKKHRRRYIGIELNEEYLKLSPDRIGRQGVLI